MSRTPPPADEPALRDEVAQLHEAVKSQRDIGMAIGLLSARFSCSTDQAWQLVLRVSQHGNVKVRTVARVLVATHDGSATPDDLQVLARLSGHLPRSGWLPAPGTEQDSAP